MDPVQHKQVTTDRGAVRWRRTPAERLEPVADADRLEMPTPAHPASRRLARAGDVGFGGSERVTGRPRPALRLLTRATSLPARGSLPTVLPWDEIGRDTWCAPLRSHFGLNAGVKIFSLAERDVVAKVPEFPEREVAATWLAQAAGLRCPGTRIEREVPAHIQAHLQVPQDTRIMVMERVCGHNFGELSAAEARDLSLGNRRGQTLARHLGRVLAYDYLIGNPDRFPVPGLNGANPGNVMLQDDLVWCIDNTLPSPSYLLDPDWLGNLHRGQSMLFSLLDGPRADTRVSKLSRFVDFFGEDAQISWERLGPSVMSGAAEQCRTIATTEDAAFADSLAMLAADGGGVRLAGFVRDNLARFRTACEAAT